MTAIDIAEPMLEKARERAEAGGRSTITFDLGDVEYLPYEDASFDVARLELRPHLRARPRERRRASSRASRGRGGRLGFTAWKPNPKLGELYRRFTEEPIEGREAYEWGREDHVEDMLGEDFELEFEDGTLWIEADSGEEIWELFSESAPPVIALARAARRRAAPRSSTRRSSSCTRATATEDGIRAPRRYLLVLGRAQVSDEVDRAPAAS